MAGYVCFIDPEFWPIEVLHCESRDFRPFSSCDLDLDPMTFIYELDPYSLEIYRMCKYELPTISSFESYHVTNRQTDMTEIVHTTPLCGWAIIFNYKMHCEEYFPAVMLVSCNCITNVR